MQASNVPGSENVEVSEFKEEDAESANKSGFNTMEVDGFENLDHSGEAVLASNKFFNYRIGYEMKKELIKLNHALNGIGYKNLIKIAKQYTASLDSNNFVIGDVYTELDSSGEPKFSFIVQGLKNNYFEIEIINGGTSGYETGQTDAIAKNNDKKYISGNKIAEDKMKATVPNLNAFNTPDSIARPDSAFQNGEDAANYISNIGRSTVTTPAAQTKPVKPASNTTTVLIKAEYVGKTYKDQNDNPYTYRISTSNQVSVSRDGKLLKTLTPSKYSNWNNFATTLNNQIASNIVTEVKVDLPTTTPTPTPTPAPTPTPTPTPTPAATPTPTTRGAVSETVNGEPAVSIGTFGKDQIFLTIDSVRKGEPQFYVKDGKSGKAAPIGEGDGRVRSALGPLEVARLADRLNGAGISQEKVEAFKTFMNKSRRQNRLPFGRKRRQEKIEEARGIMSSSSESFSLKQKIKKTAESFYSNATGKKVSAQNFQSGRVYRYNSDGAVVTCVSNAYDKSSGTGDIIVRLNYTEDGKPWNIPTEISLLYSPTTLQIGSQIPISQSGFDAWTDITDSIRYGGKDVSKDVANSFIRDSISPSEAPYNIDDIVNPPTAKYLNNLSSQVSLDGGSAPVASSAPVQKNTVLIDKKYLGRKIEDENYIYTINAVNKVSVSNKKTNKNFIITPQYKNWKQFVEKLNLQASQYSEPMVAKEEAAKESAPTETAPEQAIDDSKNLPILIGEDEEFKIFTTVSSINKGYPEFLFKYINNSDLKKIDQNDSQYDELYKIINLDTVDLNLSGKITPKQLDNLKIYIKNLKISKRPIGKFRTRRRDDRINLKMENASSGMVSTSARQNRLDKLEKKGVI